MPDEPAPTGRKPGPIPEFARNQTDLGRYLMPPRDRKIIQLAMKKEGCPGRTPDGRYPVAAWQEFINRHFISHDTGAQPDKMKLELERLRLQNDKLNFELQVKRREFSANSDVERWVSDLVLTAKQVLLQMPAKLAPVVTSMTEVEAEKRIREEINYALAQLTAKPLSSA